MRPQPSQIQTTGFSFSDIVFSPDNIHYDANDVSKAKRNFAAGTPMKTIFSI